MHETFAAIAICAALVGALLNAKGNKYGFLVWIATNTYFALESYIAKDYPVTALFICYWVIATYGFARSILNRNPD